MKSLKQKIRELLPQELEDNANFSLDKVLDDLNKFKKTKKMKP